MPAYLWEDLGLNVAFYRACGLLGLVMAHWWVKSNLGMANYRSQAVLMKMALGL